MDYSFTEKLRKIECQDSAEAKLLQDQVNSFNQFSWKYDKEVIWFTKEVSRIMKII
jgi:hypothetical protein